MLRGENLSAKFGPDAATHCCHIKGNYAENQMQILSEFYSTNYI